MAILVNVPRLSGLSHDGSLLTSVQFAMGPKKVPKSSPPKSTQKSYLDNVNERVEQRRRKLARINALNEEEEEPSETIRTGGDVGSNEARAAVAVEPKQTRTRSGQEGQSKKPRGPVGTSSRHPTSVARSGAVAFAAVPVGDSDDDLLMVEHPKQRSRSGAVSGPRPTVDVTHTRAPVMARATPTKPPRPSRKQDAVSFGSPPVAARGLSFGEIQDAARERVARRSAADTGLAVNKVYGPPAVAAEAAAARDLPVLGRECSEFFDIELGKYLSTARADQDFNTQLCIKEDYEADRARGRVPAWGAEHYWTAVKSCWERFYREGERRGRVVMKWDDILLLDETGAGGVEEQVAERGDEEGGDGVGSSGVAAEEEGDDGESTIGADGGDDPPVDGELRPSLGASSAPDARGASPKYDVRAYTRAERIRLGLTTPLSTEWCVACLRRLHEKPNHKCHSADDVDRCDWCVSQHASCDPVCSSLCCLVSGLTLCRFPLTWRRMVVSCKTLLDGWRLRLRRRSVSSAHRS